MLGSSTTKLMHRSEPDHGGCFWLCRFLCTALWGCWPNQGQLHRLALEVWFVSVTACHPNAASFVRPRFTWGGKCPVPKKQGAVGAHSAWAESAGVEHTVQDRHVLGAAGCEACGAVRACSRLLSLGDGMWKGGCQSAGQRMGNACRKWLPIIEKLYLSPLSRNSSIHCNSFHNCQRLVFLPLDLQHSRSMGWTRLHQMHALAAGCIFSRPCVSTGHC